MLLHRLLPLLLACHSPEGTTDTRPDSGPGTNTGTDSAIDTSPVATHGTVPAGAIALPDFRATNQRDQPRSRENVLGHPTVMWFYPAASTAG